MQLPSLIVKYILNIYLLENRFKTPIFHQYFISTISLVSKEWNQLLSSLKFTYLKFDVHTLDLVTKWLERDIKFENITMYDTILFVDDDGRDCFKDNDIEKLLRILRIICKDQLNIRIPDDINTFGRDLPLIEKYWKYLSGGKRDGKYLISKGYLSSIKEDIHILDRYMPNSNYHDAIVNGLDKLEFIGSGKDNEKEYILILNQLLDLLKCDEYRYSGYSIENISCRFLKTLNVQLSRTVTSTEIDQFLSNNPGLENLILSFNEFSSLPSRYIITDSLISHKSIQNVKILLYYGTYLESYERLHRLVSENKVIHSLVLGFKFLLNENSQYTEIHNNTLINCQLQGRYQSRFIQSWGSKSSLTDSLSMPQLTIGSKELIGSIINYHNKIDRFTLDFNSCDDLSIFFEMINHPSMNIKSLILRSISPENSKHLCQFLMDNHTLEYLIIQDDIDKQFTNDFLALSHPTITKLLIESPSLLSQKTIELICKNKNLRDLRIDEYVSLFSDCDETYSSRIQTLDMFAKIINNNCNLTTLSIYPLGRDALNKDQEKIFIDTLKSILYNYYRTHSNPINLSNLVFSSDIEIQNAYFQELLNKIK